jgi:predicted transcriptional regulator
MFRALKKVRVIALAIQGDQKISVHLMITIRKVTSMFKVSPASLQTFIDTPNCVLEDRVQYSTVHIPNVFCDGHLQTV